MSGLSRHERVEGGNQMNGSLSVPAGTSDYRGLPVACWRSAFRFCSHGRRPDDRRQGQKEVWTMSTLSASDWPVQPPDWPGFRMFPPLPSNDEAWNPVRVPPRARHTPSSEGVHALTCGHSGWSRPSDAGREVCLAPRVACEVVGERVQGRGRLALRLL